MASADTNRGGELLIKARNLDKRYNRGGEEIHVLRGLNLDVDTRRVRRLHGPERLGQDDAAQPPRRPRRADRRHDRRWPAPTSRDSVAQRARRVARPARRLRLPGLQPDPGAHRATATSSCRSSSRRSRSADAPEARRDRAAHRRAGGPHEPLPAAALGRAGAARRDRARHRGRPRDPALRRADRRPRPRERRRRPRAARRSLADRAREDDPDGDARPARGRARAHVQLHLDKGVLVDAPAALQEARREVPAAPLRQPRAARSPHAPDDRLVRRALFLLRPPRRHPLRLPPGHRRRPAPTAWS